MKEVQSPICKSVTAETVLPQNELNEIDILRRQMDASVFLIKALAAVGKYLYYHK